MLGKIGSKIVISLFLIGLVDLVFINWWVFKNKNNNSSIVDSATEALKQSDRVFEFVDNPSPTPQAFPSSLASASPVTKTVETKTVVEKETKTVIQTAQKEIFIPLGSGSTNSFSYADIAGSDITIDTSKYSQIDSIVFEASIWVVGGNGRAWAALYNVNDKVNYIESQITHNLGTAAVKTSGKIPFPSGQRTYRIQAKTDIVEFAARVDNARVKITLK